MERSLVRMVGQDRLYCGGTYPVTPEELAVDQEIDALIHDIEQEEQEVIYVEVPVQPQTSVVAPTADILPEKYQSYVEQEVIGTPSTPIYTKSF